MRVEDVFAQEISAEDGLVVARGGDAESVHMQRADRATAPLCQRAQPGM